MATVEGSLRLFDGFSAPLNSMLNALNLTISAFENMQRLSASPVDTSVIDGMRDAAMEAGAAYRQMQDDMARARQNAATISAHGAPPVDIPINPPAVPPVTWAANNLDVFTNSGIERFEQEIQSANTMLERLNDTQSQITQQAESASFLPADAITDIQALQSRIENLRAAIQQAEQNSLDIGSGEANAQLEHLRSQLAQILASQTNLNNAMQGMDIEDINAAYLRLSQNVGSVERSVRDSFSQPVEVPVVWRSDTLDVFTGTGAERFEQEIQSANAMLNQLAATQDAITQQAAASAILPPDAITDIQTLQNRVQDLQAAILAVEQSSLNVGSDEANMQLERLRSQLAQALSSQEALNAAMQGMDVESINGAFLRMSQNISNMTRSVRDDFSRPVEIPATWDTRGLEVFTSTGAERFEQELQSVNSMMNTLEQTQQRIASHAAGSTIFPPNAAADLSSLQNRLQAVQSRIAQIASNPVNIGSERASNELERLRTQLNQALTAQEALNSAADRMDISAANDAYNRLSEAVSDTERYIRDNVDEQGRFNQLIEQGAGEANQLMQAIGRMVAAYATLQTGRQILNVSDTLIQTQSRLNLMNDGLQTTQALTEMVYQAAQNSRGSFAEMASVVARFGNNAREAFSSSAEVVAFAELIQKQMTIAGTSTAEAQGAMLQLSQALGSGVLRGDELNSIFEQAPNLIRNIADYLGVGIGQIREMAKEGELTADVVKNAIFAAADEINENFASMPRTWGQVWQSFQNTALMVFQPVLQRINDFANSNVFKGFIAQAEGAMFAVSNAVLAIFDLISGVGNFLYDNWSWVSPVIYGVVAALVAYNAVMGIAWLTTLKDLAGKAAHAVASAAQTAALIALTIAQDGLNAAIRACPVTWIVIGILAIITVIVTLIRYFDVFGAKSTSVFGTVCGLISIVIHFFCNLLLTVANVFLGIISAAGACGENILTAFHNSISGVKGFFFDLLSTALGVIAKICSALNQLPFIEFDFSGIVGKADEFAAKAAAARADKLEYKSIAEAFSGGFHTFDAFSSGWAKDAFQSGAAIGDGIINKLKSNFEQPDYGSDSTANQLDGIYGNTGDTAANTAAAADALDYTEEDLAYLKDIAEREAINRYTTAEITVNQENTNYVDKDTDLDGVMDFWANSFAEKLEISGEGVHP